MGTELYSAVVGGYNEVSTIKYSSAAFCSFGITASEEAETTLGSLLQGPCS